MKGRAVIVIGGPTASGKTDVAIELANQLGTEIISADSRQIYKELQIGVARPDVWQLNKAVHHFIAQRSVDEAWNAGIFAQESEKLLDRIFEKSPYAIVCGGTGLYIKALLDGFDDLPETAEATRNLVSELYDQGGLEAIQKRLLGLFPEAAKLVEMSNPARVRRALELVISGSQNLSDIWQKSRKEPVYDVFGYYLDLPRDILYNRINDRTLKMFDKRLVEEVRGLLPKRHLSALNTVGYAEVFDFLDGKCEMEDCINKVQQHTRNYAKRQITWFKNSSNFIPVHPDAAVNTIFEHLNTHGYSIHQ